MMSIERYALQHNMKLQCFMGLDILLYLVIFSIKGVCSITITVTGYDSQAFYTRPILVALHIASLS